MIQKSIYRAGLAVSLLLVTALWLGAMPAKAGHPVAATNGVTRVVEARHLAARTYVKTWESHDLSMPSVYVHIYRHGVELPQRFLNSCAAHYIAAGLIVRLKISNCGPHRGPSTIRLRFVSVTSRQVFRVRVTTAECDLLPRSVCRGSSG
jgi:hypothetical protein